MQTIRFQSAECSYVECNECQLYFSKTYVEATGCFTAHFSVLAAFFIYPQHVLLLHNATSRTKTEFSSVLI